MTSVRFLSIVFLLASLAGQAVGQSQSAAPGKAATTPQGGVPEYVRSETTEERMARLGTGEDPGPDPDPTRHWFRFGKEYRIVKFPRIMASYAAVDSGYVRPDVRVNSIKELYQHNADWVWAWIEVRKPEPIDPTQDTTKFQEYSEVTVKYFESVRGEYAPITPEQTSVRLTFEEASNGLPVSGSWRNSAAVADMNGDGRRDLIFPPERGLGGDPAIYLADGKGNWEYWREAKFPTGFNYGSVVAADFNKDKKVDLAFGVHLTGVKVFLNEGKGVFSEVTEGLPPDYPTRRIGVADLDRDGALDIVAISEGPAARGEKLAGGYSRLRGYLNREKGRNWTAINVAEPDTWIGGDWLAVADLNNDKYPDFVGASVYQNGVDTVWISDGAKKWKNAGAGVLPLRAVYYATTAGRFSSKKDEAIISYHRDWPLDLSPKMVPPPDVKEVVGIERISFDGGKLVRTPIARWGSSRAIWGMGSGDFDGDGKLDVVYTSFEPREAVVLLGDGVGGFKRAAIDGVKLRPNVNYDLTVTDLDNDKRPDLVVMYESDESTAFGPKNGSVQVFLNRGVAADPK